MAFDFEKLKSKFTASKEEDSLNPVPVVIQKTEDNNSMLKRIYDHPALANVKRGLEDVQVVAHEGKYNLFVKQFIVLLVAFLVVRFICGKFSKTKAQIKDKIAAIHIQQTNQDDYLENKQHLLQLEPLFPNIDQKNDWMLRRLINVFETHNITPNVDGNVTETAENEYTMLAQPVSFQQTFANIGKLIADIENGDDFLRISEVTITKQTSPEALGENGVIAIFNTVFPKEKYAPKLFKDYDQQMKQMQAAKEAKNAKATPAAKTANGRKK